MPTTPITNPVPGESLVGTEPQLQQQAAVWRRRLNLFTGRTLTETALSNEQTYRSGLLTTLGQSVTPGTVKGLALTIDTSGEDPVLMVSPGYGIAANGMDVVLNRALKTTLGGLTIVDAVSQDGSISFHDFVRSNATTYAGILILQPVKAEVSGENLDTSADPIYVSGNLGASCDQDPDEYAFEDSQIADAVRLVFLPWPANVPSLPLPDRNPVSTWRNRLAYAIFEAEALLGPDDVLPWATLGVPLALIGFDPGVPWVANTAFTAGQFITDPNGNIQQVQSAGATGATEPTGWNTQFGGVTPDNSVNWVNEGAAWRPLFVDCSSVVRAGGLPRNRMVFGAQAAPLLQWRPNTQFKVDDFIVDSNDNIQKVQTAGVTGGPEPDWNTTTGQTTPDAGVTWINNGPATWKPNTSFSAGQFIFDPNGNLQKVQSDGISDDTEPVWNGIFLPTRDGTVIWINDGTGNTPIIQPALAQARIAQLSEQLLQTQIDPAQFKLTDVSSTLPPSGILPAAAMDFDNHTAPWLPVNWSVSAAPVHLEELEAVLKTGMADALLAAETTAPADNTLLEPVEVLVPLPDSLYDPRILIVETVAPIFQQELNSATFDRNETLQHIKAVQQELNTLYTVLGPNVPANPYVVDTDAGLTADEIQGRDTPPPYLPAANEMFATSLPTTWQPSFANYKVGDFVLDTNGAIQVVVTVGTPNSSGAQAPDWNTTVGQTTPDGGIVWLNNGAWNWQPGTAYVAGQFVIDAKGFRQTAQNDGISAANAPTWNETPGQSTADGIVWQAGGNAQWSPDKSYSAGDIIFDSNGNIQIVQTAGISGDGAPGWNRNPGQTTLDNDVTWTNLGRSPWQPLTSFSAGQAIVDASGDIQLVKVGGTSGTEQPAWSEAANTTTIDAAINWINQGPLTWQANKTDYAQNQIIIDSHGNLQFVQKTTGSSGATEPVWSSDPTQTTTDGGIAWALMSFASTDLDEILSAMQAAPYLVSSTDATGATKNVSLISDSDQTDLSTNGLQHFIQQLQSKISQANDLIDTSFLTMQTDIYRFRQIVLGSAAASALATSPVLANIARGDTADATAQNLQNYINTVIPPTGSTTPPPAYTPPVFRPSPISIVSKTISVAGFLRPASLRAQALTAHLTATRVSPALTIAGSPTRFPVTVAPSSPVVIPPSFPIAGTPITAPIGTVKPVGTIGLGGITRAPVQIVKLPPAEGGPAEAVQEPIKATFGGPIRVVIPGQNATPTQTDITSQSPISGAQVNIRTLTIGQRLQQSPSQEAMFYAINDRVSFLQLLALIRPLGLYMDDLQVLVDGPAPAAPAAGQPMPPVPVEPHTFAEWVSTNPAAQAGLLTKIQSPVYPVDAPEATLFSVGIRIVEQHTMMLRALEARINLYNDFVSLCTTALNNIQKNLQQGQTLLQQLQNNLHQDRQNVAFTAALLQDESNRVQNVNDQRQQILRDSVQVVAYTRARTLEAFDTVPSRQLVPANVASPVPACLQQAIAIPPELREIVGMLREAPVSWLPSIAQLVNRLERPILLQQLAFSAQARAVLQLQLPQLPSSAAGESGVYASAIANVYSANQQMFRGLQTQRASFQPTAITSMSWSLQVATLQSVAAINDLISAESVHTEVSNATSRLIQQISSVAACLYARVSAALPVERLGWAEFLQGPGSGAQMQSLAVLPDWNQQTYIDRQQMQLLVDWLFQQIDTSIQAAVAFMSDVVRTAILLASDVPVDNVIPGNVIVRTQPIVGGVVPLTLPSERISSGMYVNFYSGAKLAARGVVSDLDSQSVQATVTDVFTPNVFLESSDVVHFTAQSPQAVALRPFLMQS